MIFDVCNDALDKPTAWRMTSTMKSNDAAEGVVVVKYFRPCLVSKPYREVKIQKPLLLTCQPTMDLHRWPEW